MVYEWDAKRARRAHLARFGLVVLGAVAVVILPAAIAVAMKLA